ncbi:MAG: RecX family transcriptional regulator [Rhodospirillales bacterium]|nr:RecX family transcriptional regulator [Rhodospirillales bacterium]
MNLEGENTDPTRRQRNFKKPRKATPKSLENAAKYHLARFSSSSENLRRVLGRRVEKSARAHDTDRQEGFDAIDEIIRKFNEVGLLDDAVYARGRAVALHRGGASKSKIRGTLREKGVAGEYIDAAIDEIDAEFVDAELAAAARHARRRRLGPYRSIDARADRRDRDLASLARAGFGYGTATKVIDAESADELEREATLETGGEI